MKSLSPGFFAFLAILAMPLAAEDQPRWMSPEEGFIDPASQSEVTSVSQDSQTGQYRVEIAIPRVDKPIEEVLVIGQAQKKPDAPDLEFLPDYEYINDLDTGRSGIVVYLDKKQNFRLLINYDDGSQRFVPHRVGEIRP